MEPEACVDGGARRASSALPTESLWTPRLELRPVSLALIEAVLADELERVSELLAADLPAAWPGRALVERAFSASLDAIRVEPHVRLWGDRLLVTRDPKPRVIGSVIFHGYPNAEGVAEVAYGVEDAHQRMGFATEAVGASVDWALTQPGIKRVEAVTFAWHRASVRVLEKVGMRISGTREHETMGEMLVYAMPEPTGSDRASTPRPAY